MSNNDDDILQQIFPGQKDVDLYSIFSLERRGSANTNSDIEPRLHLLLTRSRPDKHRGSQQELPRAFQQIAFAYAVLNDPKQRAKYDETGRPSEEFLTLGPGGDGWDMYFEEILEKFTRGTLGKRHQEKQDLQWMLYDRM